MPKHCDQYGYLEKRGKKEKYNPIGLTDCLKSTPTSMNIVMKNITTIYNKKEDKIYGEVKNEINKDVTQWKGVGEREGEKKISYVKNLRVSFIYFIVDNRIRLLSIESREKYRYKYNSVSFARLLKLLFCRIPVTLSASVTL